MLSPRNSGSVRYPAFRQLTDRFNLNEFDPDDAGHIMAARALLRFVVREDAMSSSYIKTLQNFLESIGDKANSLLAQGCLDLRERDYIGAKDHLSEAHSLSPNDLLVCLLLAHALRELKQYRTAQTVITEALETADARHDPYSADSLYTAWMDQLGDQELYRQGLEIAQQGKAALDEISATMNSRLPPAELPSHNFCTAAGYCAHMLDDFDNEAQWLETAARREEAEAPQFRNLANLRLRNGWHVRQAFRLYRLAGKLEGKMVSNMAHFAAAIVCTMSLKPLDIVHRALDKLAPDPPRAPKKIIQRPSR